MKKALTLSALPLLALSARALDAIGFGPTITEIHYHPRDVEPVNLEFVEVYNQDPTPFDLTGYAFSRGISFEFAPGTLLNGRSYIVVAADPEALHSRFPLARVAGPFSGRLDSGGEKLALANPAGVPVVEVDYDDAGRWPHAADGTGHTLALRGLYLDPSESESWAASVERNGTPGRLNFPSGAPAAPVLLSELFAPAAGARWIELENPGDAAVDLGGYLLAASPDFAGAHAFPAGTGVPARGFLVVPAEALSFPLENSEDAPLSLFLAMPESGAGAGSGPGRVVDAYRFPPASSGGLSVARLPGGENRWSRAAGPTPGAPNAASVEERVVLNEIHYHPHHGSIAALGPGGGSLEFVELLNRADAPVDLSGFAFTKGIRFAMPQGTAIAGQGYLVVAADPAAVERTYGIEGVLGPWEGSLSDDGERIVLEDGRGNVADEVHYGTGGEWPEWADGGGSSLELADAAQDNSLGGAWAASDESGKAPWTQVSYTGRAAGGESELHVILEHRGTVLLDDVKISGNGVANYIPNGSFDLNAAGWVFEGTHVHARRTNEDFFSAFGALEVTSSGRGDSRVNKIEADTSPALPSNVNSTVSYAARWVRGSNILTTRGSNHGFAKTIDLPVPAACGTPGARNSTAVEDLGPVVSSVRQDPAVPQGFDKVRIRARISDPDGVRSARVLYRRDGAAGGFTAAELLDDGAHGDGAAGDGIFAAELPAFPVGVVVLFYIEAEDGRGNAREHPDDAPARALAYQVSPRATSSPAHVYRMILPAAEAQTLQTRKALSNDLVHGSFVFQEVETYYDVGVRYRGSPWLRPAGQKSYRVRFEKDAPFHGARKINLDMTGSALNERAAFYLIRQAGAGSSVPYSLQAHVQLRLNGARLGLYEHVQQIDKRFLSYWYPGDDQGDLYKTDLRMDIDDGYNIANARNLALDYVGNDEELYRYNFFARSNEELDSFAGLIALARAVDPDVATDSIFRRDVEKLVDVEEWVRVLAVRLLDDDWDTFGIGAKNAYFYFAPGEGRWKLFPWDMDNTFGNPNATLWPNPFYREIVRIFETPAYKRLYFRLIDALTQGPYKASFLSAYLNPTRAAMQAEGVGDPAGIYNFVTARSAVARAILPVPAAFKITSANPLTVSADAASLAGTAPYTLESLFLGDEQVEPSWTGIQAWRLAVSVHPGDNPVTLLGFDGRGNLLGIAETLVRSTAVWSPPVPTSVAPLEGPAQGGGRATIAGTGFKKGIRVFFGGAEAAGVELVTVADPPAGTRVELNVTVPPGSGTVPVTLRNLDGKEGALPGAYRYVPATPPFRRGNVNGDSLIDLSDAVTILAHLFSSRTIDCLDAADLNDDGRLDISDPIRLLNFLYLGAAPPPPPFDAAGEDPTEDGLPCK